MMFLLFYNTSYAKEEQAVTIIEKLSEQVQNVSEKEIEELIDWLKEKIDSGELDTGDEDSVRELIRQGEDEFDVELSEEETGNLVAILEKMNKLGMDSEYLVEQAEKLYSKYGKDVVNHTSEALNDAIEDAAGQAVTSFFHSMKQSVANIFENIVGQWKKK